MSTFQSQGFKIANNTMVYTVAFDPPTNNDDVSSNKGIHIGRYHVATVHIISKINEHGTIIIVYW